jgi:hypothetical protein
MGVVTRVSKATHEALYRRTPGASKPYPCVQVVP